MGAPDQGSVSGAPVRAGMVYTGPTALDTHNTQGTHTYTHTHTHPEYAFAVELARAGWGPTVTLPD